MPNMIKKDTLNDLLEFLSKDRIAVGPVDTGKVVEFRQADIAEFITDDRVSYKSMKEFYFPQMEKMFTFTDGQVSDNENLKGFLIFGARPCDTEALRVMNAVYTTGKYADPFFKRRFDANFIVSLGCLDEKPACFCDKSGVDKEYSDYCDIMLNDKGDSYVVEYLSEKAKKELEGYSQKITCENTRKATPLSGEKMQLKLDVPDIAYFDAIDWEKTVQTCLGCGMCCFICPGCHCFDFKDVHEKGVVNRYKCWDSCIYPKFTVHASGHNPREKLSERYRQRVLHKFKYVPTNFGLVACSGCGRCVRSCPVGVDIQAITNKVMEVQP